MEEWVSRLKYPVSKQRLAKCLRNERLLRWCLKTVAYSVAPRQCVGAVGAVFDASGQVLLVEHVFRTDFPWGLPGGWIKRGESPADAVRREIEEELQIRVDVSRLICSEQVGLVHNSTHPPHLGIAYYCRFRSGDINIGPEVLSVEWVDPRNLSHEVAPFQRHAIMLGQQIFENEIQN